ncbi:helix-turn-helix transcriptional regulator [Luteococcus peritonei]|uniref:Helix-turn-helix domain-containing protein n=1 Tax=Luteococcus peritonei TaxID=88874 RepID=A0ABW4RT65_9ACTN
MPTVLRPVHRALRACLAGPLVAYDYALDPQSVHLGLPSPAATLIISFDEPLDLGWLHEPSVSRREWCSISGLHLRPALVRTHGLQRGIHVSLTPTGVRALFGLPLAALVGDTVSLHDLPRGLSESEHQRLDAAPGWPARLALLEELLLRRITDDAPASDIRHATGLLLDGWSVTAVAAEVGWSRRHLHQRVSSETGLPPKQLNRLGRFDRARELVQQGVSFSEAAHRAGFADQAHFTREWSAMAGRTPKASAEEFPNLQEVLACRTVASAP